MSQDFPANPTLCFISGSTQEGLTHDPGPNARPFYVYARGKGWIALSVVIFAQNVQHVREIIHDARLHIRDCVDQFTHSEAQQAGGPDYLNRVKKWESIDLAVHQQPNPYNLTAEIHEFDGTHMLKVAWASNDTI